MQKHVMAWVYLFLSLPLFTTQIFASEKVPSCEALLEGSLFLEEVHGERALEWVRAQNDVSLERLQAQPGFAGMEELIYKNSTATDRIQPVSFWNGMFLNFDKDKNHERGILRRSDIASYLAGSPNWDIILDVDKLAADEGENWVYGGSTRDKRFPKRALVSLSRGGKDAKVIREFDTESKTFVQNGFVLPEGKHNVVWEDEDTLLVGTELKEGDLTDSGYPRTVRRWKRGTDLKDAAIVFEGSKEDISASGWVFELTKDHYVIGFQRQTDFYNTEMFALLDGEMKRVSFPTNSQFLTNMNGQSYIMLKSDWKVSDGQVFRTGSIVEMPFLDFVHTGKGVKLFFEPSSHQSVEGLEATDRALYLTLSEDVKTKILRFDRTQSGYTVSAVPIGQMGVASIGSYDEESGKMFMWYEDYMTPSSLYLYDEDTRQIQVVATLPARYDATPYMVEQLWATSRDGTKVPYFVIRKKDLPMDSDNPTWIYGYGGFEVSLTPGYMQTIEPLWLRDGGIYVVANIRGGGEFGPAWHQAALLENRQRAFDDFQAVAQDLIQRKYTKPSRIGIEGGSNGGLLMGVSITQRPELYEAAIIDVPLLDMLRYDQLLAGASWVAEYGSPSDPEMREYLEGYSPLHNLRAGVAYPEVLIKTSTADDRVHPAHARRFAYRMQELGHPYLYYENIEGGHGGAANKRQSAMIGALEYAYMREKLMNRKQ